MYVSFQLPQSKFSNFVRASALAHMMGYPSRLIIAMLIAILIGSSHFSLLEAYVDENRHLDVWNMDSEFQMDSDVHQMLLQADKSEVSYGAMRNPNRPACPNRCQEPGQPYTGRPCSKVYRCSNE